MSPRPSHRLLLVAAVASAFALPGCDSQTEPDKKPTARIEATNTPPVGCGTNVLDLLTGACPVDAVLVPSGPSSVFFVPGTHPRFSPAIGDIPLNTDLVFSVSDVAVGKRDGTAKVPGSNAVIDAINDLDGWSPNAYFDIPFADGSVKASSLNADLASANPNVLLIPLESNGDALDSANINTAAPFNMTKVAATTYTANVVTVGTGSVLRIKPTTPLLPKTKYLVVLTNGITNTSDAPITKSAVYDLVSSDAQLPSSLLQPLRDVVHGWDTLASAFLLAKQGIVMPTATQVAAAKSRIALTYTFTTTDPVAPLVGMGTPRAALFAASGNDPTKIPGLQTADAAGLLPSPKARTVYFPTATAGNSFDIGTLTLGQLASGKATLYTGSIQLPYYLTKPASAADYSFLTKFWTGDNVLAGALGITLPSDSDDTYNTTYRYPFAKKTGDVSVPLQVTLPKSAMCTGGYPNEGFPVVIYVHGITSDRTSVMTLAHALAANACIATVAIDLPMHGIAPSNPFWHYLNVDRADSTTVAVNNAASTTPAHERHFEVGQSATGLPQPMDFSGTTDGSGSWFINLGTLANSRDNLRQSVMDLMNLNASLSAIDSDGDTHPDFDTTKVSVVGVSLGGMVATTFTTVNQSVLAKEALVNAATGNAFPSRLNPVKALVASVPGGQLTRILETSPAFGPKILSGLAGQGVMPGSADYNKFMYVAQSMVDAGDPLNFASTLKALNNVPVMLQEVVGGGNASTLGSANDTTTYLPDLVVPNNANAPMAITYIAGSYTPDSAPLAGTDPLGKLLGVSKLAATFNPAVAQAVTTPGIWLPIKLGHHASLLRPYMTAAPSKCGEYAATYEMQTQAVTFIASLGAGANVGVASLPAAPADAPGCTFAAGSTAAFVGTN